MSGLMSQLSSDSPAPSNSLIQTEELLKNIEQYKSQLDQVNLALESATSEDKSQLQQLQLDLISILELTLNQLDQVTSIGPNDQVSNSSDAIFVEKTKHSLKASSENDSDVFDDEFERFKSEIASIESKHEEETHPQSTTEGHTNVEEIESRLNHDSRLDSSLKSLEGESVRAPFKERWGGYSYHNAVVLSVENDDLSNPEVLVLFSEPTCLAMLPCRFYLEGRCKFEAKACKFSHGTRAAVKDLRDYTEPDRESIVKGSAVLALHDGQDIWHRGTVEDVLEGRAGFSFNCSVCAEVVEAPLISMVPIYAHDDENKSSDPTSDTSAPLSTNIEEEAADFVPNNNWLKNALSTKLGDWEKHTKGIGSKLMAKMGYVVGTGLGPLGEGRVDPVAAFVYPQGVSLDHCMRLREASGGGCLLEVEKRLLNASKKEEEKAKRQAERLHSSTSVFDIINNKLSRSGSGSSSSTKNQTTSKLDVSRTSLKNNTTKELNIKNLQLSSRKQKLKEEVLSLKKSIDRQGKNSSTVKLMNGKLMEKEKELAALVKAEEQVEWEQRNRKNASKLCLF